MKKLNVLTAAVVLSLSSFVGVANASDCNCVLTKRVTSLEKSQKVQDVKIVNIDERSIRNESKIAEVDSKVGAVEKRSDLLEQSQRDQDSKFSVTDKRSIDNAERLDVTEESIRSEQSARELGDKVSTNAINKEISDRKVSNEFINKRVDIVSENGVQTREDLVKTNKQVNVNTAQITNHETRIGNLESVTNSKFRNIDKRFDETDRHIDAAVSGVAAMSNIPQVTESQKFAVGAGVGAHGDQSAIAVGFSARASENVVVKASVAGDSQQKWTVGGGLSYGW